MPARLFRCEIYNAGEGDLIWVNDKKERGGWSSDLGPSESARVIQPGAIGVFQAESSGFMQGTEGWATWKTRATGKGGDHDAFIKVTWDLPYIKLDPRDGTQMTVIELARYDPDMP